MVHEPPELDGLTGDLRKVTEACLDKDPSARPSPAGITGRLAPEGGAARLVSGGWLPGALVEQVSRAAVHLLNLETTGGGPADGAASGPVGFSSPSVGEGTEPESPRAVGAEAATSGPSVSGPAPSGAVGGGFGPPPVMPSSGGGPAGTVVPEPRQATGTSSPHPPTQPGNGAGSAPGRLSLSVSAASTPGTGGRGRRVSCTVALAVAGALAAVTVGSAFVFDLLPGSSGDAGADHGPSGGQPEPGTVPAAYVGTWEGQASSRESITIPLGTFRVTLKEARVGERVGTLRHTDIFGGICDDILTLKEVTAKRIVTTSVGAPTNRDVCNQARHTVLLTPVGDDLVYESDSKDSGRPEARLSKIE